MTQTATHLSWLGIARLGLVQACIGAVVVLATSTLNRVLVVELGLAAILPGILVAMHYLVQILRPRMGYGSDQAGRCTPFIRGGMVVLALGGLLATWATTQIPLDAWVGYSGLFASFALIGLGVSACGTALLTLLAKQVQPSRRARAATLVWIMMITGFATTAGLAGHLLEPFSMDRLLEVSAGITLIAVVLTFTMTLRLERKQPPLQTDPQTRERSAAPEKTAFRHALRSVIEEPQAWQFTLFVFVSMLAFSTQDLILEPFAGEVFGYSPGASTQLSGMQHAGVLIGMLLVAGIGSKVGSLKRWTMGGCMLSGLALMGLAIAGFTQNTEWPLVSNVVLLGIANGAFSIAAIASMMRLAGEGQAKREGTRMGLFGAAQAIAFALGGLLGTGLTDLAKGILDATSQAYGAVFLLEAALFVLAAHLGAKVSESQSKPIRASAPHTPEREAIHASAL
ncbi:MAG: BCD family MFS transporter [Burkholderiaceae bacterium]